MVAQAYSEKDRTVILLIKLMCSRHNTNMIQENGQQIMIMIQVHDTPFSLAVLNSD